MAHLAKYKAPSIGHMLAHYARSKDAVLERDNIDQTRSGQNYTVGIRERQDGRKVVGKVQGSASWETVKERIEGVERSTGKKVRKDAVTMADMVITAPRNVPDSDLEKFFRQSYIFMAMKVGSGNLMGGYVHMDETTPHMHVPFTPIKDGRFNFKQLCPRKFYQTFHKELGDYLETKMGYRPEIELTEERQEEKLLSKLDQSDIDKARDAVLEPAYRERDSIRRECSIAAGELEELKKQVSMKDHELDALHADIYDIKIEKQAEQDRLEELQRRREAVAGRVEELRSAVADVRRFEDASRSEKGAILDSIAGRCDAIRERVDRSVAGIRERVQGIRQRIAGIHDRRRQAYRADDMKPSKAVPSPARSKAATPADDLRLARQQSAMRSGGHIARGRTR